MSRGICSYGRSCSACQASSPSSHTGSSAHAWPRSTRSRLRGSRATRRGALGANLVLAARTKSRLDDAAKELREKTRAETRTTETNVKDYGSCEAMAEAAVARFGSIDGLINNATGNFLCASEDL